MFRVRAKSAGDRITFNVHIPTGNRTVTLAGTLKGDEIAFVRTATMHEGGAPGGQGFFGVTGAPTFVARRVAQYQR